MRKKPISGTDFDRQAHCTRITVTIPPQDYAVVRNMAKSKKVSAAWIVRDAVEKYIQNEALLPL